MTLDVLLSRCEGFRMQWQTLKQVLENERGIVLLWWREVGEVDCQDVAGIKSKLLVPPA